MLQADAVVLPEGITYHGDVHIDYGGTFVNVSHWRTDGYAEVVDCFEIDGIDGDWQTCVAVRIVNRPDSMDEARATCGWDDGRDLTDADEILMALSYYGGDPDYGYPDAYVHVGNDEQLLDEINDAIAQIE